ncbi:MAG: hypothetical protein TUN42_08380 [Dehalogenimonas sp.]
MRIGIVFVTLMGALILLTPLACTNGSPTVSATTPSATTTAPQEDQPIQVVVVINEAQSNAPWPLIRVTLRNISTEPIETLKVTLKESANRTYEYDFRVSAATPMAPCQTTTVSKTLTGGDWVTGSFVGLEISGTLKSGQTFAFTWNSL